MSTRRSKTRERRNARGGLFRRVFAFEPLEGRSLLSGTDIGPDFDRAWTGVEATREAPVADYIVTASPQRVMAAAMRGRFTFPETFDATTFDSTAVGAIAFDAAAFGLTTFAGIGNGANDRFAWSAFAPRFGSVMVSTPALSSQPYFAKAFIYADPTDTGVSCIIIRCDQNAGGSGYSLTVNRFALSEFGGDDRFASVDRAFDVAHGGLHVLRLSQKSLESSAFDAWFLREVIGSGDAAGYLDLFSHEWKSDDGKPMSGRERPLGVLPYPPVLGGSLIVGGAAEADGDQGANDGENGGFIGLSTMSDSAPFVSNAFAQAAERGATNDVSGIVASMPLTPRFVESSPSENVSPFAPQADKSADAQPTIDAGQANVVDSEARGVRRSERSIARADWESAPPAATDVSPPTDDANTQQQRDDVRADVDRAKQSALTTGVAAIDESLLAAADGEGGMIALAVATLPNEPIVEHSAVEAWYVEDARPRAIAATDDARLESSVGLYQVFDVAAVMPVVSGASIKEDAPRPKTVAASLFASLPRLAGNSEQSDQTKPANEEDARVEEASVGADVAIAAASAVALSAGLSLRRKGPVAKLRAMFERWPRRIRNRRAPDNA